MGTNEVLPPRERINDLDRRPSVNADANVRVCGEAERFPVLVHHARGKAKGEEAARPYAREAHEDTIAPGIERNWPVRFVRCIDCVPECVVVRRSYEGGVRDSGQETDG